MTESAPDLAVLETACATAGISSEGAELIRAGENIIYRLPGGIVARISPPGQQHAARREVAVSRWLEEVGIPAVRAVRGFEQPVDGTGNPVIFWHELPPHRLGTTTEIAAALRHLHSLPPPTGIGLAHVEPFVRLPERIHGARWLDAEDRAWMFQELERLRAGWRELPEGKPWSVIHGDAHEGNIVAAEDGTVLLLDLERSSIGPPEWDVVQTVVNDSLGWLEPGAYQAFCEVYGHDVTYWSGFQLLRDIREFRMTAWLARLATDNPQLREQSAHRIACLRGKVGPRPWRGWSAVY